MQTQLETLIAQGGSAYIRNLAAAEAAIRRGEFNVAKVLRVAACVQRTLALRLARMQEGLDNPEELLETILSEVEELDRALPADEEADPETRRVLEQIAVSRKQLETLLRQSVRSLQDQPDIQDTQVAQILWVCLHCGFVAESDRPDPCPVCEALGTEFAWYGPFYVETSERLGRLSPAQILATLETLPREMALLPAGVSEAVLRACPSEGQWCAKEILGHLVETDRLFLKRAGAVLERDDIPDLTSPRPPWLMHEGKGYEQMPVEALLERLQEARSASLALVQDLNPQQWSKHGTLRGDSVSLLDLGIWLANHDLGHKAQIRRLCGQ